jgi:hypothetical protein
MSRRNITRNGKIPAPVQLAHINLVGTAVFEYVALCVFQKLRQVIGGDWDVKLRIHETTKPSVPI